MIKNKIIDYLQRFWYNFTWAMVVTGFRFYFRRWQIANLPKMKQNEPVIYVANHQNAFLDALSMIFSQKRHPVFLVRANIFASPIARFMLRSLNMLPIYRKRDGANAMSKNEKMTQDCIDILMDGRQPLAIYVEGNHSMLRSLRPIKKGVARIAFSTLEQNKFKMKLKIIPVGIYYSKHTRFRSDLLVNFGEPMFVNNYHEIYKENPNKAYLQLAKDIYTSIEKLVVNIADRENYEEIEKAWINKKEIKDNMLDELHNDQKIVAELIKDKKESKQLNIETVREKKKKSVILMILGFPLFVYGTLNHLALIFLISRILAKVVTDIHFYGSIKLAGGVYLGGIIYLLQAIAVYALSGSNIIAVLYFVSLPFIGSFAYDYYLKHFANEPHTTSSADLLKGYK